MEAQKERKPQYFINSSNANIAVLSEDTLRQYSKSLTKLVPSDVNSIEKDTFRQIQSTLQDILQTASSPKLSSTHGAAALNALCGFLEQCSTSSETQSRHLSYDTGVWTQAFHIYLVQSENIRSKPLRRLLVTLTRLISKHPVDTEKNLLLGTSICIATRAIRKQDDFANIKPAVQVLEHFLSTGLISAAELAQVKWPEELGQSRTESMKTNGPSPHLLQEQINRSVQDFAISVLEWIKYPDCAPAVGRFLFVLFKTLEESQSDTADRTSKDAVIPKWISPVKQSLERHQELLETFEIHILPCLLRLGPADVEAFLRILPYERIQRGNIGSSSVSDIRLCLLVAKTAEDPSLRQYFSQRQSITLDLESIGTSLLEHSSSTVRLAALSLLVSSSASTRPYSRRVLHRLRQCIPYFHVEVNAKPRNEFIALMKKLCTRLRDATLSLLRRDHLPHNLAREQVSTGAPLLARNQGEGPMSTENVIEQVPNKESHILEEHLGLRKWYIVFLLQELRPTATYQRHITSLKVLECLTEQAVALRNTVSLSRSDIDYFITTNEYLPQGLFLRSLTELLLDPFDDVRHSANRVFDLLLSLQIRMGTDDKSDLKNETDVDNLPYKANNKIYGDLTTAEYRAGTTGRADHADGLGRLYNLLSTSGNALARPTRWHDSRYSILNHIISTLEVEVGIAIKDLLFAVSNMPLHGHLIALRYIVSRSDYVKSFDTSQNEWEGIDQRIVSICSGVWDAVHDVLCSDAPEGYDVSEEDVLDQDIGTKDTLSFCWRALKESSLLMHAMVTSSGYSIPFLRETTEYEGSYVFGNHAFMQLAELRHRGAFSTVSHTFAACCLACARSSRRDFQEYPKTWFKLALNIINDNASSVTRRSAGIPAIIVGVLAAYPVDQFFNDVIVSLQAMANAPVGADLGSLPQVHALNCLKDIFTDARFGPSTEIHIAHTLNIAALCLESHIWNIRNCGLMLFKALLKRLNGGTDVSSTKTSSSHRRFSQLIYEKYPNLPDLLLRLLRQEPVQTSLTTKELHLTMQAHRVFPALELIERSGIPSQQQGLFLDALRYYNESPDWSIREKAARALSLIVDEKSFVEEVRSLLAPNWKTQNALHGRLLRVRFLLARYEAPLFGELLNTYETIASIAEGSLGTLLTRNLCPITATTFLNIYADLFATLVMSNNEQVELFLMPVLAMEQEIVEKYSVLNLPRTPLRRCITLADYVHALKGRPRRKANPETFHNLRQVDIDALQVVNLALQNMSDETDLAVLRFCSARQLRRASDITQISDSTIKTTPKNLRQSDYNLALHGYALGERFEFGTTNPEVQEWIRLLSEAGAEHSDLRTRTASVFSIRAFVDSLLDRDFEMTSDPQLLGIYLALYDSLIDDDEDVRDQGAKVVSTILSVTTSPAAEKCITTMSLSPPAAREEWFQFLRKGYGSSMLLCVESLGRLVGMTLAVDAVSADIQENEPQIGQEISVLPLPPVVDLYLKARSTSNVVFVEERQNLYIDTVSEAEDWAGLLCRLDPDAWPSSLASELEAWTIEGLSHIHEIFQDKIDAALTSKPEVFTLFTRIILAANVLIKRHMLHASPKGKHTADVCVGLLEKLLDLGRSRILHDLLQHRIEVILGKIEG